MALGDQAMPSGVTNYRNGRGFGEAHGIGYLMGVAGRGGDVFGMAAVQVDSDALLGGAILIQAQAAVLTMAAFDPVVQDHPVSLFKAGLGVGADGNDFAGHVAPQDSGKRSSIAAAGPDVQVQVIQSAATHPQHHFAGSHFRLRPVTVDKRLGTAVFVDINRLHSFASWS